MNRLADAHSPYLRQHAHNPVDWWPWCDEAFAEARARDVPVFLSIGYAACHWCHVMERESFEDEAVAALMNARFVNIKVDREERPDVDALYLEAMHVQGRAGGWPASLWLDHARRPFYAGTYFPPRGAYGRPGFTELLRTLDQVWRQSRGQVEQQALQVVQALNDANRPASAALSADPLGLDRCVEALRAAWDEEQGGWGQGQRFPIPARLELLLAHGVVYGASASLGLVRQALEVMDRGGLHDPLGGGFHRYCVDPGWEVPHFEKMLYDNAQLLRLYARAASALGVERYAQVAQDTALWLLREMQDPDGGFWASLDADSGGHEGTFYVWTPEELDLALPPEQARLLARAYGVTRPGNFEGRSVLFRQPGVDPEAPPVRAAREALRRARDRRPRPATDTKLVTAWNGLAIGGLATAGRLLGEPSFTTAAARAADRWLRVMGPEGGVPRTLAPGAPAGVLEDYALLGEGLLDLYDADPDPRWLLSAERLGAAMLARFGAGGALYRSEVSAELPVRTLEVTDGAEPSGYGRGLELLRRLLACGSPVVSQARLEEALSRAPLWRERPALCPSLAWVHARLHADTAPGTVGAQEASRELVLATPTPEHPGLPALLGVWNRRWRPAIQLALTCPAWEPGLQHLTALRHKRPGADGPRVYLCVNQTCGLPLRTAEALARELDGA